MSNFYAYASDNYGMGGQTFDSNTQQTTDYTNFTSDGNRLGTSGNDKHYCVPENFDDPDNPNKRSDLYMCYQTNDPRASLYPAYDTHESCAEKCNRTCSIHGDTAYCKKSPPAVLGAAADVCKKSCGFYCKDSLKSNIAQNYPKTNPNVEPDKTSCGYSSNGENIFNVKSHVKGCFPKIQGSDWIQGCTNFLETASHFTDGDVHYDENNAGCGMVADITRRNELPILDAGGKHHLGLLPPGQGCFCEMQDGSGIDEEAYIYEKFGGRYACKRNNGWWLAPSYTSAVMCMKGSTPQTGKRGGRPYLFCKPD